MDIIFLIVFYIVGMLVMSAFLWGKATERAYEFHKNMYWGRLLGKSRYYVFSHIISLLGMIGLTIGVIFVLVGKIRN